jgi:hypothetical protein
MLMKDRAYIDKSTSHLNVHFYYVAQTMLLTCEKPCEKHVNNTDVNNTCEKLFVSFLPSPNFVVDPPADNDSTATVARGMLAGCCSNGMVLIILVGLIAHNHLVGVRGDA